MRKLNTVLGVVALLAMGTGCAVRSDSIYAKDVEALLETRGPQVSQCYGEILKANPSVAGTVAVRLTVEEDTGAVVNPSIESGQTTAPQELQQCVLSSLAGLTLQPPDTSRPGTGVYVWNFGGETGAPVATPVAAPAG